MTKEVLSTEKISNLLTLVKAHLPRYLLYQISFMRLVHKKHDILVVKRRPTCLLSAIKNQKTNFPSKIQHLSFATAGLIDISLDNNVQYACQYRHLIQSITG